MLKFGVQVHFFESMCCRDETFAYLYTMKGTQTLSNPQNLSGMSDFSFCNVRIQSACGQWSPVYSVENAERMSANAFIKNAIFSLTRETHGWQMVAQMLTEAVCIRKQNEARFAFNYDGEPYEIIVSA